MRQWAIINNNDEIEMIRSKKRPKGNVLSEIPYNELEGKYERLAWLQLEDVQDAETGEMVPTLTVNQALKDSIVTARENKQLEDAQNEQAEKDRINVIRKKIHNYDPNDVKDLKSIKKALNKIVAYLNEIDLLILKGLDDD